MVFARMVVRSGGLLLALWLAALLAACAAVVPAPGSATWSSVAPAGPSTGLHTDVVTGCERWLTLLDQQVDGHAVRDGGAARVPGFRFLRVDRLLASYRDQLGDDAARWQAWGQRLMALDAAARQAETAHLPPQALQALGVADAQAALARVLDCATPLWASLSADPMARARLQRMAQVPDDYSPVRRALGLYALTRWPFLAGVQREQRLWQARWDAVAQPEQPEQTEHANAVRTRYRPAASGPQAVSNGDMVWPLPLDALGLATPDAATAQGLLARHAPVIDIDTAADHDRPGRLAWGQTPAPEVKLGQPVVYQRIAHTRVGERSLLQLVYSLWFPERPARSGLDLLAGQIDAVVLRLTLDERGRVLLLDSIHACGCFHMFVPSADLGLRPAPNAHTEWAFVPARLPALAPGQRLRVRLAAVDHQPIAVTADPDQGGEAGASLSYTLLEEESLRSLPTAAGGRRSAFWPNGIMPGTERGERALFWPMGIESPGAMRQWGRQPTAFVGRRHFDDAYLLADRFEWPQLPGVP